ncbi:MAG: hypothetical protein NVSMB6_30510 [Burkholderiaceae bacterium]
MHWTLITTGIVLTFVCGGHAALAMPATQDSCRQQGLAAEKLAVARDQGLSMNQAIEAVIKHDPDVNVPLLREAAKMLFHRFRYMPQQQVAFEFTAACLDEAE